ncbi:hypothetical protein UlMin_037614 [Ulmus minor]
MRFSLKNAGANYQRLVNKMFKQQIGKTMEVYVDDMLVKSLKADEHINNLRESFEVLREYKMKLNPAKCAFGVTSGKFLGFMVNHRGIEANPIKIQTLLDMKSPRKVKEVQSLTGRQALAEFMYQPTSLESAKELVPSPSSLWNLYVDGSSTDNCSGAGVILVSPEGVRLSCALRFRFKATNNQAEYEALLVGLRLAKEVSAHHLLIYSNSQLIVNQVNSEYQAKGEKMAFYLEKAKELLGQFDTVTITQIPRNENTNADTLACLATGLEDSLLKTVPLEILDEPSIDKRQQVDAISDKPTWMDLIMAYLRDGTLPQDKFEARRL